MAGNDHDHRATLDEENPETEKTGRKDGERSKSMCSSSLTLIKEIRKMQRGRYRTIWSRIFVISCVFAVYLDPFFFYVVFIDQDNKCLQMDKTLSIVACVMRSLTDIIFLVHLICEICDPVQNPKRNTQKNGENSFKNSKIRELIDQVAMKIARKMPWLSVFVVIDFFALIPLPQLLIGVMFYRMKGSGFVEHKNVLNFFLLCQYFPRIYRIYLSAKEFQIHNGIWVKGLYNMFLYILSSHVLGAIWYFFSVQRELTCWQEACVNHNKDPSACLNTFNCDSRSTTARNIIFLNEYCPLDTRNGASSPFNFGIFLDSLQNKNTEHIPFRKKFFYSFWWGLRNLSNFGTNLMTSTYVFENLFAVLICVVGLLLFLYLIGNVQTFMQMEATKTEQMRQKIKKLDVKLWMSINKIPLEIQEEVLISVKQVLKKHIDADLKHIDADLHTLLFSLLPRRISRSLKRCLCMKTLKKIEKLQDMDDKVLTSICDCLTPMSYSEKSFLFRKNEPVHCLLFIIQGTVAIWPCDSQAGEGISKANNKGDFYGEKLLEHASDGFSTFPLSSNCVQCQTKVETLVLTAKDLNAIVSKYPLQWGKREKNTSQKLNIAASTLARELRSYVRRRRVMRDSQEVDEAATKVATADHRDLRAITDKLSAIIDKFRRYRRPPAPHTTS